MLDLGHTLKPVAIRTDNQPGLAVLHLKKDGTVTAEAVKSKKAAKGQKSLGSCPLCGGDIIPGKKAYGCSNWQQGCSFVIWKTIAKKNITQAIVKELLEQGITAPITDFTSKAGKPFTARLKVEKGKVAMDFNRTQ
ncbi:MAG: topoisomerase C-terminal repeat-containing protein [Kiritimatiellae bacterium]|nr:topoisomerase C-terminal repeat-containing protein [Kiritimatiellia bacterium]